MKYHRMLVFIKTTYSMILMKMMVIMSKFLNIHNRCIQTLILFLSFSVMTWMIIHQKISMIMMTMIIIVLWTMLIFMNIILMMTMTTMIMIMIHTNHHCRSRRQLQHSHVGIFVNPTIGNVEYLYICT